MMKQKLRLSAGRMAVIGLQLLLIPTLTFFIVYNIFTVNALNRQMYDANRNVVSLYQRILNHELSKIEMSLLEIVANNSDFQQLLNKATQLEAHVSSYNIIQQYNALLNLFPQVAGLHILSEKNGIYRSVYNENYRYQTKVALEAYLRELVQSKGHLEYSSWFAHDIGGTSYLFRMLWVKETYAMCSISMDNLQTAFDPDNPEGFFAFFTDDGTPYTQVGRVRQEGIRLDPGMGPYYVSGASNKYFVAQAPLKSDLNIHLAYIVPYGGIWRLMDRPQILLLAGLVILITLVPLYHKLQSRFYFKPLRELVDTINAIRGGRIGTTMRIDFTVEEFNQAGTAFNAMMDEIKDLKILAYEKEMQRQRIEMQYLQIQIRPHFFLNCLKNLYGLAQQEKHREIQEMIVMLSDYIRYMFRDSSMMVPVRKELMLVESYIRMLINSTALRLLYETQVDDSLLDLPIPQMVILTFVENSVKHGARKDQALKIHVKVQSICSEEDRFINIVILDNGVGFSPETLERLNVSDRNEADGDHIGIDNVKNRLSLLYEGKSSALFSNTATGACVDLYLPCAAPHMPNA